MKHLIAPLGMMLLALGCDNNPPPVGTPCNTDVDCPAEQFCGTGGCQIECRVDLDCVPHAPRLRCAERGRCVEVPDAGFGTDAFFTSPCPVPCDDDLYCNGTGFCAPEDPLADADGCIRIPACPALDCDEAANTCDACADEDKDDDGFDDIRCGGVDCNDYDPDINPDRPEVCDAEGRDEDCNELTHGARGEDSDGDGFWPPVGPSGQPCCNGTLCGADCADRPGVDEAARDRFPEARETCNELDDDCDGLVDEGVAVVFYRDADCDLAGIAIPNPVRAPDGSLPPAVNEYARLGCDGTLGSTTCVAGTQPGWVRFNTDCDDGNAAIRPGATELCDGPRRDENCSGTANEGCVCSGSAEVACGGVPLGMTIPEGVAAGRVNRGRCQIGTQTCMGGTWSGCTGGRDGIPETCDDVDEDCDGVVDNGVENSCGQCLTAVPPELCNGRDDNCDGIRDPGCTLGETGSCDWGCGVGGRRTCASSSDGRSCYFGECRPYLPWGYFYTGREPVGHACGYAVGATAWEGNAVCRNWFQGPYETRLPRGYRFAVDFFYEVAGNADITLEAVVDAVIMGGGGVVATQAFPVSGSGTATIEFEIPTRLGGACPYFELYVHIDRLGSRSRVQSNGYWLRPRF